MNVQVERMAHLVARHVNVRTVENVIILVDHVRVNLDIVVNCKYVV